MRSAESSALTSSTPAAAEIVHDVILVPQGKQTLLFAHYISMPVPPYGIMIGARRPALTPGIDPVLPILLRDGGTRDHLEITDFIRVILEPTINAAMATVSEDTAQDSKLTDKSDADLRRNPHAIRGVQRGNAQLTTGRHPNDPRTQPEPRQLRPGSRRDTHDSQESP